MPVIIHSWVSQVALVVKNPIANAGDKRDVGSIPGLERSPGEGHDNPLQHRLTSQPLKTAFVTSLEEVVSGYLGC